MRQADADQADALTKIDPLETGKGRFPDLLFGIGAVDQAHGFTLVLPSLPQTDSVVENRRLINPHASAPVGHPQSIPEFGKRRTDRRSKSLQERVSDQPGKWYD